MSEQVNYTETTSKTCMNKFEDARMNKFKDARPTGQKEVNIMGKYEQDARRLLEYVGGKENIAAVSHCVSRMRFVLNDPAKADVAKIEALKSAKGTFTQAGQFQVIIGNTVSDFYNDFIAVSGIDGVSKDAVKSAAKAFQYKNDAALCTCVGFLHFARYE